MHSLGKAGLNISTANDAEDEIVQSNCRPVVNCRMGHACRLNQRCRHITTTWTESSFKHQNIFQVYVKVQDDVTENPSGNARQYTAVCIAQHDGDRDKKQWLLDRTSPHFESTQEISPQKKKKKRKSFF